MEIFDVGEPGTVIVAALDGDVADVAEGVLKDESAFFGELTDFGIIEFGEVLLPKVEEDFAFGAHVLGALESLLVGGFDGFEGIGEIAIRSARIGMGVSDDFVEGGVGGGDGFLDGDDVIAEVADHIAGAVGAVKICAGGAAAAEEGACDEGGDCGVVMDGYFHSFHSIVELCIAQGWRKRTGGLSGNCGADFGIGLILRDEWKIAG
jgi:hypothetical protein